MDELIKALKEKYLGSLTQTFALHQVAIFLLYIFILTTFLDRDTSSLWLELARVKLKDVLSSSSDFVSDVTFIHILIGFVLSVFTNLLYKEIKEKCFNFFASKRDFDEYVKSLSERPSLQASSDGMSLYLVQDIREELKIRKATLVRKHTFGEIYLSLAVISFIGAVKFNIVDSLMLGLFTIMIWSVQIKSFEYYVSKIVPALVSENFLLNKGFSFRSGFDN